VETAAFVICGGRIARHLLVGFIVGVRVVYAIRYFIFYFVSKALFFAPPAVGSLSFPRPKGT
jgi:hypothetical protein